MRLDFARLVAEMLETFLVPANTTVKAKGEGAALDLSGAQHRVFLLTLSIANIVEQEALEVRVYGSTDGTTWHQKPLATLPLKFYRGEYPFLLDLSANSELSFLRAQWEPLRWGRGDETPMFTFSIAIREIPAEVLAEARTEAVVRI